MMGKGDDVDVRLERLELCLGRLEKLVLRLYQDVFSDSLPSPSDRGELDDADRFEVAHPGEEDI